MKTLIRLTVVAAGLFGVYFLFQLPALYARVKLDRSFPALSRYQFERTPQIALVGSSMTSRLHEGYFGTPLRNLSIGGGSPLTGLSIIASYEELPKLILVEINIMSRPIDHDLVEQFGHNPAEPYNWFRPARALISTVYYWVKYESETENVERLPKLKPTDHDISKSVGEAHDEYHRPDWRNVMRPNVDELKRIVASLEERGCKIILFELPSPVGIAETPYTLAARALAHEAFPDGKWITISDEDHQLRWLDASHLDTRSSIVVVRQIEEKLSPLSLR